MMTPLPHSARGHRLAANIRSETGRALRRVRQARGLTLRDVGVRSNGLLTPTAVAGYERGERGISVERFCELCELYGVRPVGVLAEIVERVKGRVPVVLDLTRTATLGGVEGKVLGQFVEEIRSLRGEKKIERLILRSGDVEVLAAAAGDRPEEFMRRIAPALQPR
jgi:transcriptional regulator with XRE-family HTH domain